MERIRRKFTVLPILWMVLITLELVPGCNKNLPDEPGDALFTLMPASETHADFVNLLDYDEQLKKNFNIYTYRNFYNGGGVALGDINNDGFLDMFLTSNMGPNVLYLNGGDLRFEDISATAGIQGAGEWSTGVSMADVNGDGWIDIYVCNSGNVEGDERHNELYINNGDLTFTEAAGLYGINDEGYSTHGAFFDYDLDGDLDLYLLNNSFKAIGSFDLKENMRLVRDSIGGDKLYRNDNKQFIDVSEEAGIHGSIIGFGLGVTVGDVDQDGWMDIYVSNDFFERDYLYINKGDGTFSETLTRSMRSISAASMGADMADINNDHYPEIFVTDMIPEHDDRLKTKTTFDSWDSYSENVKNGYHHQFTRNMLHLNNRDGTFSEIGRLSGVYATDWSWGALIMDLDNDGMKDLFVANGIYQDLTDQDYIQYFSDRDMVMTIVSGNNVDYKTLIDAIPSVRIPSYAFRNMGSFRFQNMSGPWGLAQPSHSNGSAYGDLDNDGDLDLVVSNVNMPMFIYRNETSRMLPDHHFLKVILAGEQGNTSAIGAKVTVRHRGQIFYLEQMPMRGFKSTVDPRPNLGLGPLTRVDTLVVQWPTGGVTLLTDVETDTILTLYQPDAGEITSAFPKAEHNLPFGFEEMDAGSFIPFIHMENEFNDFGRERLIYHMMSTEGPRMCNGDVNGDGREDLFIAGARNQPGMMLLQERDGRFRQVNRELFEQDRESEDVDCALFDADSDGDLDLYVAHGGNEFPSTSSNLVDRLYLNLGRGQFTRSDQSLPVSRFITSSCVRPADYDLDGQMELFVGTRLAAFHYGVPASSFLLENDGNGNFRDVTAERAPGLQELGMVRDMTWEDVNGDGLLDMILVGEWMPLKIFLNRGEDFQELEGAFGEVQTEGWWNCLATGDFDGDGDVDLVAGNHGLNSRFKAAPGKPVTMYVNDFDLNGRVEQIICTYDGDTSYPLALKHDLVRQLPSLDQKLSTYESYKGKTVDDLFPAGVMENSVYLEANLMETSIFLNDGTGRYTRGMLPPEVQFSPVMSIETGDYDGDGDLDMLMGGNLYNVKPEVGRYDASYGTVLMGDGTGKFQNIPKTSSGFWLEGEVRDLLEMNTASGRLIVVARNNDAVQLFRITGRQ